MNVKASSIHVNGIDNGWADTCSRDTILNNLISQGWLRGKRTTLSLQDLNNPGIAAFYPKGAEVTAPRAQLKAIKQMRDKASGRFANRPDKRTGSNNYAVLDIYGFLSPVIRGLGSNANQRVV